MMVVLMMAGVPASGGGHVGLHGARGLPALQEVLPLPAAVDIARSLRYFDGVGVGQNLLVIAIWGAVGLVLNLLIDKWLTRRPEVDEPGAGPAPAASVKLVSAEAH